MVELELCGEKVLIYGFVMDIGVWTLVLDRWDIDVTGGKFYEIVSRAGGIIFIDDEGSGRYLGVENFERFYRVFKDRDLVIGTLEDYINIIGRDIEDVKE